MICQLSGTTFPCNEWYCADCHAYVYDKLIEFTLTSSFSELFSYTVPEIRADYDKKLMHTQVRSWAGEATVGTGSVIGWFTNCRATRRPFTATLRCSCIHDCWVYNCAKKKSLTLFMILKHTRTWLLLIKILTTPAYCIWLE